MCSAHKFEISGYARPDVHRVGQETWFKKKR